MHSFTLVLIPADTQDIKTKVDALLESFSYEKQVEPYKAYVTGERLQSMAKVYKLHETDSPALAAHVKGWFGAEEVGIDEGGLFYISARNPQGTWDWWGIGGRWNGVLRSKSCSVGVGSEDDYLQDNSCLVGELPDNIGSACVVTPDGRLYQEGWGTDNAEKREEWRKTFRELLVQYNDCLAVGVDCHS